MDFIPYFTLLFHWFYTKITSTDQEDYSDPTSVVFETGDREGAIKCSVVEIRDDSRVEGNEMFLVAIVNDSSTQPVVTFGAPASIIILDDDSKWGSAVLGRTPY